MLFSLYRRRKLSNSLALGLACVALAIGLFFLAWILLALLDSGFAAIGRAMFVETTPPPGSAGGLSNAIYGSLLVVGAGTVIGTPVGIMAGIYLAEFGRHMRIAAATRFINDILLSAPSIIIGLFVYTVYVAQVGHFSGWAGSFALALLVIPVVVRTTENMLRLGRTACARRRRRSARRPGG